MSTVDPQSAIPDVLAALDWVESDAVAGSRVTRLTETTLAWNESKPQPALLKKLREMGIFLR